MAAVNGYLTAAEVKAYLQIGDTDDDTEIDLAIGAASRAIDQWCGQRFWQDDTETTRYFTPDHHRVLRLMPAAIDVNAATLTSVTSVDLDRTGNGTFETSWTEGTEFFLAPRGASASGRPYDSLKTLSAHCWPVGVPDSVKVVGTFGWPDIPDEVKQACAIQASVFFQRSTEGASPIVTMSGDTLPGGSRYLDREVQLLLRPFRQPAVA